ncbi:MAG TPA: hypothetical protein VGO60_04060 [Iamia sp.]|nr:hypothetical protein [Iamia sp.]
MPTAAFLFARTVGFGEAVVLAVIIGAVVMISLVALRNRTGGDG